jgi:hypothetical protein
MGGIQTCDTETTEIKEVTKAPTPQSTVETDGTRVIDNL